METRTGVAVARRTGLGLALAAAGAALLAPAAEAAASGKGMVKVTVLYGEPKDPAAFESYYLGKHMPMVYRVKGIARIELGKPGPGPDGKPPAFYRITELWFKDAATLKAVTSRPEWKKIVDDVPNFASGGATILVSPLE
nr:EthD family reductase [uncultured Rhodopila sp.]